MTPLLRGSTAPLPGRPDGTGPGGHLTLQAISPPSTEVGDLVVVISWQGLGNAPGSAFTIRSGYTQVVNHFHDDGTTDGCFGIAWIIATQAGAQVYQAFDTSSPATDCRTALRVYQRGTFDLSESNLPANNDIVTKARSDVPFAQQSGWTIQTINTFTSAQNVPENGIHGTTMPNGETMRFGKQTDPLNSGRNALVFQCHKNDPLTSLGIRSDLHMGQNIQFQTTYWACWSMYIYDWGSLASNDTGLMGMHLHTGSPHPVGGGAWGIYAADHQFSGGGNKMQVQHRYNEAAPWDDSTTLYGTVLTFNFGQWYDFVVKFKLDTVGNGLLQVWRDGQQIHNYTGKIGWNTGYVDYMKCGYYNWGTMSNTARKVLIRHPTVVRDPTGSTYTMQSIANLLSGVGPGIAASTPVSNTSGATPPNPAAITGLNSARNYRVESIGAWWCVNGTIDLQPVPPSSGDPLRPYADLIETTSAGWLDLAVIGREMTPGATQFDGASWGDNVDGTTANGTLGASIAILGSVNTRRALAGWGELEVTDANFRRAVIGQAELETESGTVRSAVIGHAELQASDYEFPGKISLLFHKTWARYRYTSNNPTPPATRRGRLGWAEVEAPVRERRGHVSHAEIESPNVGSSGDPLLGFFPTGGTAQIPTFEAWLGRPVDYINCTLFSMSSTPAQIGSSMDSHVASGNFNFVGWVNANPSRRISFTMPLTWSPSSTYPLQNVANGLYDSAWRTCADRLASYNCLHNRVTLRLGWEFDGDWYAWRANAGSGREAAYKAAFRHVVEVMRARQPSAQWRWSWCGCDRSTGPTYLNTVYPGADVVDEFGMDLYDRAYGIYPYPAGATAAQRTAIQDQAWTWLRGRMDVWRNYSQTHSKPLTFAEWGVAHFTDGSAGDDNPRFIQRMHDYFVANNIYSHNLFNADNPGQGFWTKLQPPTGFPFPQSAAKFLELFG